MNDAVVARLYDCLVQALLERGRDLDRPITVAEVYQDFVPYREVRDLLGVEMNADYEHALLRLFAGEGGYVRLDPPTARDELLRELRTPNPHVGVFRNYAACDVWVSTDAGIDPLPTLEAPPASTDTWEALPWGDFGPGEGAAVPAAAEFAPPAAPAADPLPTLESLLGQRARRAVDLAPAAEPVAEQVAEPAAAPLEAQAVAPAVAGESVAGESVAGESVAGESGAGCAFCGGALPSVRPVRFCPSCGANQSQRPCRGCGEALERSWRFCITCGEPAPLGEATA